MKTIMLPVFVLFSVLSGTAVNVQAAVNSAAVPTNRGTDEYHQQMNAIARKGDIDLLFVGDSITMGWRGDGRRVWDERFAPLKAANFGLGGDKTEHVLWRLQNGNLDGITPKVVVMLIGTNNVGRVTSEELAEGITANVREITKRLPATKVILMGLLPRGETPDHPHRLQVIEVNGLIAKLHDDKQVFYSDVGQKMMRADGSISTDAMPDLLHLNDRGYQIWADGIKDLLAGLMK